MKKQTGFCAEPTGNLGANMSADTWRRSIASITERHDIGQGEGWEKAKVPLSPTSPVTKFRR
jgi:hypothetical protein